MKLSYGLFETYVENEQVFTEELRTKNKKALEYFKDIKKKKNVNFKNWGIFHNLYKNETVLYYLENFLIMNLPIIAKFVFKVRYSILKILGKR